MTLIIATLLIKCTTCGIYYRPAISNLNRPQVEHLITKAYRKLGYPLHSNEREALADLCWRESSFRPSARSKKSSAEGLYQLLKQTREDTTTPSTICYYCQTLGVVKYLHNHRRYKGSASRALHFHKRKGWY